MTTTSHTPDIARYFEVKRDKRALALIALFTVVIAGALLTRPYLTSTGVESAVSGQSTGQQAATGAGWAIGEAAIAAVLLAFIALYRYLPDYIQEVIVDVTLAGIVMLLGATAYQAGDFLTVFGIVALSIAVLDITDAFDVWWIVNDLLVLAIAIYVGAYIGVILSPWVLAIALIGLSVYDYVFADKQSWMFTLGGAMLSARLPILFIIPETLRLDWDDLVDAMNSGTDEEEDAEPGEDVEDGLGVSFGIGTADLILPAGFVVSLVSTTTLLHPANVVVVGAALGVLVACLRVSWKMTTEGGGAGLPPLTSGALAGWGASYLLVVMLA